MFTLIARRSSHYAGTRYLKRGVNKKGRVANDVETEQIVYEAVPRPTEVSSVVQHRGSIPLFWSQDKSKLNIKPDIILHDKDKNYEATKLHFENLSRRYGNPIIILNLIKTCERRECILRREFDRAIRIINESFSEENTAALDPFPAGPHAKLFIKYTSACSLLMVELVRSNSRRFMPSQADEEAHQLSYLQKHMANILTLLSDSVDGEGDESMVLTMETFEHLGFLLQFSEGTPLSQSATFFANSDPDMPAAPVPAAQVHDWILQNIASSLEYTAEKSTTKDNSQQSVSDPDVTMADAGTNTRIQSSSPIGASVQNNPGYYRNTSFVEGFSKTSVVKQASDIKGHSIKVLNCHDSVIYILAPLKYATVYGCSDTTVVLGAVGKVVKVEHCERVQIIAASKRICIANCRECIFYLGVNNQPLIVGDNHKLQVAPFNTYYPQLGEHLAQVGVDPNVNKWDQPFALGVVDPHDSLSHPAGVSDVQAESATCLDPDLFTNFLIPSWFEAQGPTKYNPFTLPEVYWASERKKNASLEDIQKNIRELELDDNRKKELACALHAQFKDWLYASGNIRQLYCLQGE